METEEPKSSSSTAEFVRLEENREQLLRFNGHINGKSTWILLDSGASKNFVDKKFVEKYQLPQTSMPTTLSVELANGRKKEVTREVKLDKLELNTYRASRINTQVLDLQRYDAIFKKP